MTSRTHTLPQGTLAQALIAANITPPEEGTRAFNTDIHENLEAGKVIFEGKIRTREDVAAELDSREVINHGVAFFDPQDVIEVTLTHGVARAAFTSTLMWTINGKIVSKLYGIYKQMRDSARATGNIDGHNEFCAALCELDANSQYVADLGYAEYGQGLSAIRALVSLRDQWDSIAASVAKANGTRYQAPVLMEMLAQPPQVDAEAWKKEEFAIKYLLEATGANEEEITAALKGAQAKNTAMFRERLENQAVIVPALRSIFLHATSKQEEVKFWELPTESQRDLIESIQRSAKKAVTGWIARRDITTIDFVMSMPQLKALDVALTETLNNPKFTVH